MPSLFPGMNPYLEHSDFLSGIYRLLISKLLKLLAPQGKRI